MSQNLVQHARDRKALISNDLMQDGLLEGSPLHKRKKKKNTLKVERSKNNTFRCKGHQISIS